jgi:MFS family permease
MKILSPERELKLLKILFFLFGIQIMSWVPRFPEVKANLGLSNGEFGSLVSFAAIGNLISQLIVGHLVHKYGAKWIMYTAATFLGLSLSVLTNTASSFIFLVVIIIQGAAISAMHVSINSQGFHFQDRTRRQVVTLLSGFWSSGALITSIVAGFMVDRIALGIYSIALSVICLFTMLYIVNQMSPNLVKANTNPDTIHRAQDMLKGFKIDRLVSGGLLCAIMLEFAIGDWAAIFVKEDMGIKSGIHTLPFILFTVAMITGRLNLHKLLERYTIHDLAVKASLLSGLSFISGIAAVNIVGTGNKLIVVVILSISFTIAGLGSSFLGPSVMNAANNRSKLPASMVIGQVGIINTSLVFIARWVIAWTAQATSLTIAFLIPAAMLLTVPYFAKVFKPA